MRIDVFEGKIKSLVWEEDEGRITIKQLKYVFEEEELFRELQDDTSVFAHVLTNEFLQYESDVQSVSPRERDHHSHKNGVLSVEKLMVLSLLYCAGSVELKCRCLYDVLQDDLQERIAA